MMRHPNIHVIHIWGAPTPVHCHIECVPVRLHAHLTEEPRGVAHQGREAGLWRHPAQEGDCQGRGWVRGGPYLSPDPQERV